MKRIHVARQLFQEPVSCRQPAAEILHEALEPLIPLDAGRVLGAVRQWRRHRQPEMDEQGKGLAEHGEIFVKRADLSTYLVEAARHGRFQPIGCVARQEGCDRRLDDGRLRHLPT